MSRPNSRADHEVPEMLFGVRFERDGLHYGVCLNKFLMTVTDSADTLTTAIQDMIDAHIEACEESGRPPFSGLIPAPKKYWAMWLEGVRRQLRSELLEPTAHRPPVQLLEAA